MTILPLPCSPSSSWAMYRERLRAIFNGADPRVCTAFWLFGLINNVLYVVILSAALDLVGPDIPKGAVLLADVIPSFLTKLCAPYFIGVIPYATRIPLLVASSTLGMTVIALSPANTDGSTVSSKVAGIILASLSSGGGELSFLGLTHFYGPFSLAAWGSGTGGAGLIGAGVYAFATTTLGLGVRATLLASAFLPLIMLLSFFVILPRAPLAHQASKKIDFEEDSDPEPLFPEATETVEDDPDRYHEESSLMAQSTPAPRSITSAQVNEDPWASFKHNLGRSRKLFFPYMLPLLLVYVAEYSINQGVATTLLFPLDQTPFKHYRGFYPTYNAIYQAGVFISRSSTPFFRVHHLYIPSFLQIANLTLLILQSLFNFIPNVYFIFLIIFWEGLLGGLVYVNTFAEITDHIPKEDREFSLGATSVSDSGGICIAGFVGIALEVSLCKWQVLHGRDWCTRI
ncbi:MAG: G1/S-specific cyclin cln3 [Cirrosporium novae-zelandiae]|nr:MAG: G1/S-specific cyclin cln3 [Cirrosporium novae-zelandiae]